MVVVCQVKMKVVKVKDEGGNEDELVMDWELE